MVGHMGEGSKECLFGSFTLTFFVSGSNWHDVQGCLYGCDGIYEGKHISFCLSLVELVTHTLL